MLSHDVTCLNTVLAISYSFYNKYHVQKECEENLRQVFHMFFYFWIHSFIKVVLNQNNISVKISFAVKKNFHS